MGEYGLSESVISDISRVFQSFPELEEVILYGSRAMGSFRNGSDIDITLVGKGLNLHSLNLVSLGLDGLMLPYTFDISIFDHIDNEELLDHIGRKGVVLYRAEAVTD
ncbi:MAG: nucleotidyltransferase domain-containing protein [Candidatus Sabulitectum sp.]|nr:nucleotidyltransferase domain-containing protein [Candidatus Sabulitectum sp.]